MKKTGRALDVAIVGLACRFPGARDASAYWENILSGRDCTGDVPPGRWDPSVFVDPASNASDRVTTQRGGYLEHPIEFDPALHGIMPLTVAGGEPEQFLVLDAAKAALADAGLAQGIPDGRRVEVVIGRGNYFNRGNLARLQHGRVLSQTLAILRTLHPDWSEEDFEAVRADLKAGLPPFNPSTIPGQVTNATAGRVANQLDISGASYVVDAASASSLVALDLGARALVGRRADLALVGGVYLSCDVDFPMVFSQLGALSKAGRARPFAGEADGTLPGEGVGVLVLKRLADAERDDDRIYAVLKGVGLASDGKGPALSSPSARGHARAIRRAYRRAGIDPATVGFVEGHGLGVPASDRAELKALRAVFPPTRWGRRTLGAVSAQIGHAMPAAGLAGLIKAALSLQNRVIPPSSPVDAPNPLLSGSDSPFALNPTPRPWIRAEGTPLRRAGVNAFGFAGISAHAVLEEHARSADGPNPAHQPRWETEAILLSAPDRPRWIDLSRALLDWLDHEPNLQVNLKDLAYTINTDPHPGPFRVGLVATSPLELRDKLRHVVKRLEDPSCRSIRDARGAYFWEEPLARSGSLAFLFPGEGSQYPRMLADLCPHFPEVRTLFDTADRIALEQGKDRLPSDVLFGAQDPGDAELWEVGTAVNVVLSSQWALHQLLRGLGLCPDAVVGHSSGEFLALASAGAIAVDSVLEARLGELGLVIENLDGSGVVPDASLLAVAAGREKVESVCGALGDGLTVAMDNCPHQVVLAGRPAEVDAVAATLRGQGVMCEKLPFARAYHTSGFVGALGPIRSFYDSLTLRTPSVPVYSCATSARMADDPGRIKQVAVDQWAMAVEFRSTVEAMHRDGVRIFVEVGARGNLTGFVEDTLRNRPHFAVAANLPRRSGLTQLNHLAASLFAQGVDFHPAHLYHRRSPTRIDLSQDLPAPSKAPALAVGFPEMALSVELAETLRNRARPTEPRRSTPSIPAAVPTALNGAGHNGHAHHHESHDPSRVGRNGTSADVGHEPEVARAAESVLERSLRVPRVGTPPLEPSDSADAHGEEYQPVGPESGSVPSAAPSAAFRAEAMMAHLRMMDEFLETQRQVMGAFAARNGVSAPLDPSLFGRPAPSNDPPMSVMVGPWIGEIQSLDPGRSLVARRSLEVDGDPVGESHTLGGRRVSALDPERKGLPVLPFTVMAEMLAQAAAPLVPGGVVVALRDLQAHRWIRYEEEPVPLEFRAECDPGRPDEVRVQIYNRSPYATSRLGGDGPVVEGVIVFADARPAAPPAQPFALADPGPCRFTASELYDDQWLFHGPALQAIVRVGESSPSGIEGTLKVLPRRGLLRPSEPLALHTDPIVLDAFTQLLGCWGLDKMPGGEGDLMFPLRVGELAIFGHDPAEGELVECRIAVQEVSRHRIRVDSDLVGPDGRVWVRFTGWEDWRFYWPSRYRDHFRQPDREFLGEPLFLPGASTIGDSLQAVWLEPPSDMAKPVWRDVLEWVQLETAERQALRAQQHSDLRFTLELWGRIAAKEAVRRIWAERGVSHVYPADLVLVPEPTGRFRVRSLFEPHREDLPDVAFAFAEGVAVAIAVEDPDARVGIAVESIADAGLSSGPEVLELRPEEIALLESLGDDLAERDEWSTRFACGKRAVIEAVGEANATPEDVEVIRADPETGDLDVRLTSQHRGDARTVRVTTARRRDHAWAWTALVAVEAKGRPSTANGRLTDHRERIPS